MADRPEWRMTDWEKARAIGPNGRPLYWRQEGRWVLAEPELTLLALDSTES